MSTALQQLDSCDLQPCAYELQLIYAGEQQQKATVHVEAAPYVCRQQGAEGSKAAAQTSSTR